VTIGKSLVEQERKHSQQCIDAPSVRRFLHRVTNKPDPEARQGIMVPVRSTVRNRKLLDFTSNCPLSIVISMMGEDESGETKMTSVTKLFGWKIAIVEEAQKLTIIHRTSARRLGS
jgi:hypothetical protein